MAYSPNPNPANAPGVPAGRNQLALVSFLLSLVFPAGVILYLLLGGGIVQTVDSATPLWYRLGSVLEIVGIPTLIAAIVIGHIALGRAKRYSLRQAWRGLAIAGLVFGYLSLVVFLGAIGLIIWILNGGIKLHFVF